MHQFLAKALALLQKYKTLVKKQLSADRCHELLVSLELEGRLPRGEVALYQLMARVVKHLQIVIDQMESMRFSGTLVFLQDMQDLMGQYRLEDAHLVHASQLASSAMVGAIQLMVLPNAQRTQVIAQRLEDYALKVAKYGLKEQQLLFLDSLDQYVKQDRDFFSPLIISYQKCLQKYADSTVLSRVSINNTQ